MTYSVARAAGVRYLANGTNPLTPQRIGITVTGAGKSGSGSVVVKKKGCEDAPACVIPGPPVPPSFEVIARPNGYNNRFLKSCEENPNALGAFVPIEEANSLSTELFTVQVCFDKAAGQWRFRVPQTIQVNALLDLCVNNVPRGVRLIDDITEVDAVDRCGVALRDFTGHYSYPVRYEKYLLRSVLLMHEEMHRLDFQEKMLSQLPDFIQIFSVLQNFTCDDFSSLDQAQARANTEMTNAVKRFLRGAANHFNERRKTEQDIHKLPTVKLLVDEFVQRLNCQN